jgi:hypothetical protein
MYHARTRVVDVLVLMLVLYDTRTRTISRGWYKVHYLYKYVQVQTHSYIVQCTVTEVSGVKIKISVIAQYKNMCVGIISKNSVKGSILALARIPVQLLVLQYTRALLDN